MPLTQEDKDWFKQVLDKQRDDLKDDFNKTANLLGKRVARLEHAFSLVSRAARSAIVEAAKKEHDARLREMFDGADLLLIPPYEGGARRKVPCDIATVRNFITEHDPNFEVELNRQVGFRLVHKSRSAQVRRKAAASLLRKLKPTAPDALGLNCQYDKSWELRTVQTSAHKFLRGLKEHSDGLVTETSAKGGFLVVNGVRMAAEYLVPHRQRWNGLFRAVYQKIRGWGTRTPVSTDVGLMNDIFGAEFAADHGVFEIDSLDINEFEGGVIDDDDAMHGVGGVIGAAVSRAL